MEAAVTMVVIALAVMFIAGIVMSVMVFLFNKKKRFPVPTIVMSVLLCPMIYIPLTMTIGFTARLIIFIIVPYSIAMIIWAVKNIKSVSQQ